MEKTLPICVEVEFDSTNTAMRNYREAGRADAQAAPVADAAATALREALGRLAEKWRERKDVLLENAPVKLGQICPGRTLGVALDELEALFAANPAPAAPADTSQWGRNLQGEPVHPNAWRETVGTISDAPAFEALPVRDVRAEALPPYQSHGHGVMLESPDKRLLVAYEPPYKLAVQYRTPDAVNNHDDDDVVCERFDAAMDAAAQSLYRSLMGLDVTLIEALAAAAGDGGE